MFSAYKLKLPVTVLGVSVGLLAISKSQAQPAMLDFAGGTTMIALASDDAHLEFDRTLSADLFVRRTSSRGQWFLYLEGNSSLSDSGISTRIAESNSDAGSALDPDRKGRVQISELNYQFINNSSQLTIGLLDPSAYLDRSRITNDENVQFLGASFVNNTTIEFPDYTLGMVYQRPAARGVPQINAVLTSAAGLADNPNLSYSQLFQIADEEDGVFAALGLGWVKPERLLRVGAWVNTRDHSDLQQQSHERSNYGVYAVAGQSFGEHGFSARVGYANPEVSAGSAFTALAWRWLHGSYAIGAGWSHTFLSSDAVQLNQADNSQAELYARYDYSDEVHLTASLQHINHSGFTSAAGSPLNSALIAGVRLHLSFD